jgi:hypothetical protein
LATAVGLSVGAVQFTAEPWLKFALDGKTLFIAKKPYRSSLSWGNLDAANIVMGGKTITINGLTYKVRLIKGANANPTPVGTQLYDPAGTENSEWNRLMYAVSANDPTGRLWASYTDADLAINVSTSYNGRATWCQESSSTVTTDRVHRGSKGVTYFNHESSAFNSTVYGWRPVLELVV